MGYIENFNLELIFLMIFQFEYIHFLDVDVDFANLHVRWSMAKKLGRKLEPNIEWVLETSK